MTSKEIPASSVLFLLNGKKCMTEAVDPATTLLQWLRYKAGLKSVKEGCAEGDCGACMVILAEINAGGKVELKAVNSCILFLPSLMGKGVFTSEYLSEKYPDLHPCQSAMVEYHGSQCGFCTPGFIVSLLAMYENYPDRPPKDEVRHVLAGNLCRCTGYRPILEAADRMYDKEVERIDREKLAEVLAEMKLSLPRSYSFDGKEFHYPQTALEMAELKEAMPEATILAGSTDLGLLATKRFLRPATFLYTGHVKEMGEMSEQDGFLRIGAGVDLENAYNAIGHHYPNISELAKRFASLPVRNAGTLGGNVANGSPIGDSMPALIVLGTRVVLHSREGERIMPMEDFYISYGKKAWRENEYLLRLEVPVDPLSDKDANQLFYFNTYKICKRYDSDISSVCGAFAFVFENSGGQLKVRSCKIAFGGMAAVPKRAESVEQALLNQIWNYDLLQKVRSIFAEDFQPLTDLRATSEYRLEVASNLLERFMAESLSVLMPSQEEKTVTNVFEL